ncbi:hypothetical protein [Oculatella sp. FACHB-28]|nr:hypothetical protein [Oculatella sp. FACHB-28]
MPQQTLVDRFVRNPADLAQQREIQLLQLHQFDAAKCTSTPETRDTG